MELNNSNGETDMNGSESVGKKIVANPVTNIRCTELLDTDALNGLRGIATLHVLLSNYVSLVSSVDLFGGVSASLLLVLSGYTMTILYGNRNFSWTFVKEFYIRRLARVLPLCYISLVFSIMIGLSCKSRLEFGLSWIYLTGWLGLYSFNYPLWTMSIQLLFYAFFPFFLIFVQKVIIRLSHC